MTHIIEPPENPGRFSDLKMRSVSEVVRSKCGVRVKRAFLTEASISEKITQQPCCTGVSLKFYVLILSLGRGYVPIVINIDLS